MRTNSQKSRILRKLRASLKCGLTTGELMEMGIAQFQTRIFELRRDGYDITCDPIEGSAQHLYKLEASA